jgi:multiple sugar transport system permease protein
MSRSPGTVVSSMERNAQQRLAGGRMTPYLFMAPFLALFGIFVLGPSLFGVWISLHEWDYLLPGKPFVGVENYTELLSTESADGELFWESMRATGTFTLLSVPLLVAIPLGVAIVLNQKFPGRSIFRAVYFAPYVLGVAVIGVLWRFALDPNVGLVNYYLGKLGLPDDIPWTTQLPWGWISLVSVTVWWTLGFNCVIFLAGLQDISREYYDAAKTDGANGWQTFRHVTVPGLRPVIVLVLTITILASGMMFGQSYLITQGAPSDETRSAIMYIAEKGLRQFDMGNAAAMSYILSLFLIVISLFVFRFMGRRND